MKKLDKSVKVTRGLDQIRAMFPENNILTQSELRSVRGGQGDGDGGGDIVIIPKK
jgi:hypothetical protein